MTTKITGSQITNYTVETEQLSNTAVAAFAKSLAPKITTINVANSAFSALDDAAVNIGGGYLVVTGSEFQSGASVLIDTTAATSVTYINSTTLHVQVPSKSAASYNLYVVNPDGGTGIRVAGVTYSASPTWITSSPLPNQLSNVSFNVSLSATGATSYSNTTAIPSGTQLLSNGYFYGTVTVEAETLYTFDVKAEDAELQDSTKTFQVTITLAPTYFLYVWGDNGYGQLGTNDTISRSSPVQVGTSKWSYIFKDPRKGGQFRTTAAIKDDGTLWMWGDNSYGRLGHNDTINKSSPVQVGAATNWLKGAMSYRGITFGIKTDNTLWAWGAHNYGMYGDGIRYSGTKSSPVQVGAGTWKDIACGNYNISGIKTDGTLWSWGSASGGSLGLNTAVTVDKSSPTQVGTATDWSHVEIADLAVVAYKTNGTLWAWGYQGGQAILGLNDRVDRSSPTQIGTSTNWTANVSISGLHSSAIKTDGTMWSWGNNADGYLGLNDRGATGRSSPTQVGTDTTWKDVSVNFYATFATKTNGSLWTWGVPANGTMGLNLPNVASSYRSSPVQVGTETTWNLIRACGGSGNPYVIATKST